MNKYKIIFVTNMVESNVHRFKFAVLIKTFVRFMQFRV